MANSFVLKDSLPVAPLKIAALEGCKDLATKVNDHIVQFRRNDVEELMRRREDLRYRGYDVDPYLLHCSCPRFGIGEDKAVINESVRDTDVFVMVGVMNYNIPYTISGYINHMSLDDHSQGLKRTIGAYSVVARRVNVAIPFLCESRQHRHNRRESLDRAMALEKLAALGMGNIITFDAHDPRVQNVIPLIGFDNFVSTCQFVRVLFSHNSGIHIDKEHLMVVSPDEGAVNRIVYLANNLGVDMGTFYKHRDYSQVVGGCNPIMAHELLDSSVEGKAVLIIDDMIPFGENMLDTCKESKEHRADKATICYTFSSSTDGLEKFDEYYHQGYLDYVITINLNYRAQEPFNRKWYLEADMSRYLAAVISFPNHDCSISASLSPTEKIQKLIRRRQNGGYEYFQKLV